VASYSSNKTLQQSQHRQPYFPGVSPWLLSLLLLMMPLVEPFFFLIW